MTFEELLDQALAFRGVDLLALRQGDLPRALPLLERTVGICQEAGFPAWFPLMAARP